MLESPKPSTARVVAAVIQRNGNLLLCQRPAGKRYGLKWEFPGGKLRVGETLEQAAVRELREELGVGVEAVGQPRFAREDPGSGLLIEFIDVSIKGEPTAIEHADLAWVSPSRLLDYPLAPTDFAFAQTITGKGR